MCLAVLSEADQLGSGARSCGYTVTILECLLHHDKAPPGYRTQSRPYPDSKFVVMIHVRR
jgi:hypothetical protein